MSWFARSIANTFKSDDENDQNLNQKHQQLPDDDSSPQSPRQGVKEDLTEITKTLTRQFWGVASLLSNDPSESSDSPEPIAGIRKDFAEIGGKFRSGISKLSNNIDVSGIAKLASDLLQSESEDEDDDHNDLIDDNDDDVVGVTEDVVAFASDIAVHPETWLNFPLPNDDNNEDFDMSDVQQKHAIAVEQLAPSLGALRFELCPRYMDDSSFWKIYFVLLHPRLEPHAAQLLSTPNILKARALLTHELNNHSSSENAPDSKSESVQHPINSNEIQIVDKSAIEAVEYPIKGDETLIIDKSVIKEEPIEVKDDDADDADDWLKEESSENVINRVTIPIENVEDVSFSDFEDDDDDGNIHIHIHYKKAI
ncbi:uncharacterized protein [Rutidosis leptorrhynchoides]|uniref:uncharacterized protein n=1 Tax=Rutidosis leptorrhynchoides TaxID=125765 RepID=UPI003A993DF0